MNKLEKTFTKSRDAIHAAVELTRKTGIIHLAGRNVLDVPGEYVIYNTGQKA